MYSPPASACWPAARRTVCTRPPTRGRASSTVTRKPARSSSCAATSPARPAPTTTTRAFDRRCPQPTAAVTPAAAAPATNRRRVSPASDVGADKGREDDAVHVVLVLWQRSSRCVRRPGRGRLADERRQLRHRRLRVPNAFHVGVERLELGV